ncbi:MAG: putative damage-inducible protein DinB [Crocinitomix sp.]|jgi:uncharacterized damage-inducible protein DinB
MIKRQAWIDHKFSSNHGTGWQQNIRTRIGDTTMRLAYHTANMNEHELSVKLDGAWSIKEHIGHLADLESLWKARFTQFENQLPELVAADMSNQKTKQATHNELTLRDLLEQFNIERTKLLNYFDSLSESTLEHKALHPRLAVIMQPVDLLHFIAEHDDHHLTTIIALKNGKKTN